MVKWPPETLGTAATTYTPATNFCSSAVIMLLAVIGRLTCTDLSGVVEVPATVATPLRLNCALPVTCSAVAFWLLAHTPTPLALSPRTPVPLAARPATSNPALKFCPYTPLAAVLFAFPCTPLLELPPSPNTPAEPVSVKPATPLPVLLSPLTPRPLSL